MEAYAAKMHAGTDYVAPITASKLALMLRKMRAVCSRQVMYLGQCKAVLSGEGVSIIQYPFYLSFAHETAALAETCSGETLAVAVATNIGKWSARGLTQAVLETIRTQVFNIGAPTP
jgi:hypothetical protein